MMEMLITMILQLFLTIMARHLVEDVASIPVYVHGERQARVTLVKIATDSEGEDDVGDHQPQLCCLWENRVWEDLLKRKKAELFRLRGHARSPAL